MKFQQTYCVVDQNLRILWVGGEWDEFAIENQGSSATANAVLSTTIDQHVVGDQTKTAVVRLIQAVLESQNELKIDYRCDSPHMLRRFQLTVKPMKEDRVLMVHDLRDAQNFSQPHAPWHYRHDAEAQKCSFCCAVAMPGGPWVAWSDLDPHPAAVNYVMCPTCTDHIETAVADCRANQKTGKPVVNGFGP